MKNQPKDDRMALAGVWLLGSAGPLWDVAWPEMPPPPSSSSRNIHRDDASLKAVALFGRRDDLDDLSLYLKEVYDGTPYPCWPRCRQ
jgi:hypothetical protein